MRLLAIDAQRIHVIHLGVDPRFKPQDAQEIARIRQRYQLPDRFVLFVGTLQRKGIDTLIDALAALSQVQPALGLVIAGKSGWYWNKCCNTSRHKTWQPRCRCLTMCLKDLVGLYAATAAALTLPSRYEGFGLPVLEAMASGTPVVTTNVSSLPEVTGEAGLMVAPDDVDALAAAIHAILNQPALHALRARGLERAREFSWARTARATLQVYDQVHHPRLH